ncbi:cytochrome c biogenesis protein CcsB [Thiomicrorhabdus immobilis]|uniref:Cytochrome c biogenesis protein CcsB n=1 Tax=Thiomicrorhabdus immobilis TaxID=2791037 RepID=A0ABN6CXE8_9GAMM|nr:c-type cytochrome [Thiomicrorhabdus immobilis]BCN93805.1 cytochrome c biogenesis protein CcsB [Thiomicrorhabdus immobilis]
MKNTLIALAAAGLVSFGAAAQAGDATAGQAAFATCVGCHGAAAEGGVGPKLAGQAPADIVAKLHAYKAGEQVGPMTSMMAPMAAGLSDADMENIAAYVASL